MRLATDHETLTADVAERLNALPVLEGCEDRRERSRRARKGWIPLGADAQQSCREADCAEPFHLHIEGRVCWYRHGRKLLRVALTSRHELYDGQIVVIVDWVWACHYQTPVWGYPGILDYGYLDQPGRQEAR